MYNTNISPAFKSRFLAKHLREFFFQTDVKYEVARIDHQKKGALKAEKHATVTIFYYFSLLHSWFITH